MYFCTCPLIQEIEKFRNSVAHIPLSDPEIISSTWKKIANFYQSDRPDLKFNPNAACNLANLYDMSQIFNENDENADEDEKEED